MENDRQIQDGDDGEGNDEGEQSIGDEPEEMQLFLAILVLAPGDQRQTIDNTEENEHSDDDVVKEMNVLFDENTQGKFHRDEPLNGEMNGEARGQQLGQMREKRKKSTEFIGIQFHHVAQTSRDQSDVERKIGQS